MTSPAKFGGLPIDPLPATDYTQGDTLTKPFGSFCQAVILDRCAAAWETLGEGTSVVESLSFNDPHDNTFNVALCPALFVFRPTKQKRKIRRIADSYWWKETEVRVLWVPAPADQDQRARRSVFFDALFSALAGAVTAGRSKVWVDEGDTDASAPYRGSSLVNRLGLSNPLEPLDYQIVDMQVPVYGLDGVQTAVRHYEAIEMPFRASEDLNADAEAEYYEPNAADGTITTNGDLTQETVFGDPLPATP